MSKHSLCKHKDSCIINALSGFIRGAAIGLGIRTILTLLSTLLKQTLFKNPKVLLNIFSSENLKLVFFLSGMVGIHRSVLCTLRAYTSSERISSFIAGFAGGLPLAFECSESRTLYSLYMLIRSLDAFCKYLLSKGKLLKIPYCIELLYILSMTILIYSKVFEPESVNRGFYGMMKKFEKFTNDLVQIDMVGYGDKLALTKKL